jgi:hypothetical protein
LGGVRGVAKGAVGDRHDSLFHQPDLGPDGDHGLAEAIEFLE